MKPVVIGFDTSCYTTSMAVADLEGRIIASSRKLLPVGKGSRGLRQSEMVFHHTRQLPERAAELAELMQDCRVAAVCASSRPRDDEQSYMPAFQVGGCSGTHFVGAAWRSLLFYDAPKGSFACRVG